MRRSRPRSRQAGRDESHLRLPAPGVHLLTRLRRAHDDGGCGVIGGYVYRGTRVPSARGRYVFGDLCTGIVSSFKVGPRGRASTPARLPGLVDGLSSFGEDANGELYALSLDGTLYQLR